MNSRRGRLFFLLLLAAGSDATATVTSSLSAGTLTVSSDAGDAIAVICSGGNVLVNGVDPGSGAATCASVVQMVVNGDNLPNTIDLSAVNAVSFPQLTGSTINAQGGNDGITGSDFADQINGGLGDDNIVSGGGNDHVIGGDGIEVAELGDGDDVFVWNPGDDNDVVDGEEGNDTLQFNGATVAEIYSIVPNGNRVQLARNVANVTMDLGAVEQINLALLGGADSVTLGDISDTSLSVLRADLAAAGGTPDGLADSLTVDGSNDADGYTSELIAGGVALSNGGRALQVINADPSLDTITVNALGGNDTLDISGSANNDNFLVVNNAGAISITTPDSAALVPLAVEALRINGLDGDDTINASVLPESFATLALVGGNGNDTLTGGDGADLLDGGAGNDLLDGDDNPVGTTDTVLGGDGDDTMVWKPGKDDDINVGGPGNDLSLIVGGSAGETFSIAPSPPDANVVRLQRTDPAPFFVDISETETLRVQGNDGDDTISAIDLPAEMIALELLGGAGNDTLTGSDGADLLDGGPGNDQLDGDDNPVGTLDTILGGDGDDTIVWNPGKDDDLNIGGAGDDLSVIRGGGGDEQFRIIPEADGVRFERTNNAPAPFFVQIRETERLQVNAGGGSDRIEASALTTGLIALELNGDAGNDTLIGGPDADVLNGGEGNDSLQGGPNPLAAVDRMSGDAGDDLLLWNPGESSDLNEGGEGSDTLLVNGAGVDEHFELAEVAGRVILQRVLPSNFVLDNGGIEIVQLNTAGGDDEVRTEFLATTAQQLDGGAATTAVGDHLIVRGYAGRTELSPILSPGAGAIAHSNFETDTAELGGGSFSAALDGAQEVPPVTTAASGRGSVVLNANEDEITVRLSFTGLGSNSTMAHIHGPALPGTNAGVIFTLAGTGGTDGEIGPVSFPVTPTQVQQLNDGLWYFNVHSVNQPAGEIRGQLLIDELFTAPVQARQVVPRSLSTASGYATLVLAGTHDQAMVTMTYAGLVGEGQPGVSTAVRVHAQAGRGQIGPVVASFVLPASGTDQDSFVAGPFPMSAGQVNGLRSGGWYIEVESLEFPQGEIRGQFGKSLFFDNFE